MVAAKRVTKLSPALVLQGEHGEEPIHDTASLVGKVPHLSARVLARVDAVTPGQVRELAEELLPRNRFALAALGDLPAGELAF